MKNSVIHFEIPADDLDRAKKFYSETFGWNLQDYPDPEMKYVLATTTEVDEKQRPTSLGINGGMGPRTERFMTPTFAISVESVDDAVEKIKAAGGEVITEKMTVGNMGYLAYFRGPEGNVLSVWENIPQPEA